MRTEGIISPADTGLIKALEGLAMNDAQRQRSADFIGVKLPYSRAENWRWTDLHGAVRKSLTGSDDIVKTNDRVSLSGDNQDTAAFNSHHFDQISLLAGAFASDQSLVSYLIEQNSPDPLVLTTSNDSLLGGSHVQIRLKAGCHAILLEQVDRPKNGMSVDVREFVVEPGAHLSRILICENAPEQTRINQAFVEVGENGHYTQFIMDFGARLSRIEAHITYTGSNANVTLNGAYLLDGIARADATSIVHHKTPGCTTRQLHKGVVLGQAQAVFQGKFHVDRLGQQTDAQMGHHSLLLSEQGRVRAKPELEIYADDVACAHGNTTGSLDKEALFYMRQRGLPDADARTLLTRAFLVETAASLPDDLRTQVCLDMDNWLERQL